MKHRTNNYAKLVEIGGVQRYEFFDDRDEKSAQRAVARLNTQRRDSSTRVVAYRYAPSLIYLGIDEYMSTNGATS